MPKSEFPRLISSQTLKVDNLFAVFEEEGEQYKQPILFLVVSVWEEEYDYSVHQNHEEKYYTTFTPITLTELNEKHSNIGFNSGIWSSSNLKGIIDNQEQWVKLEKKAFN